MRITPLDVRKQEFRKSVRGFDCDEVLAFLSTLADEYEIVLVDNKQLRDSVMDQDAKIEEYKNMERTLRDTLMTAERLMQETRENANREGNLIIKEAQIQAKQVMQECRVRTEELRRELVGLRKEKETYLARFHGFAQSQIQFIESHKNDFEDLDRRLVEMVDTVITGVETDLETQVAAAVNPAEAVSATPQTGTETVGPGMSTTAADRSEVDIWREYSPGETGESQPSTEARTEARTEDVATDKTNDETTTTTAKISAAVVDMATMGIPVPAVPAEDHGHTESQTDPDREKTDTENRTESQGVVTTMS